MDQSEQVALREVLLKAARQLETNRSLFTEHEASLLLASSLVSNPLGLPNQDAQTNADENLKIADKSLPDGVKDGWLVISDMATTSDDFVVAPAQTRSKYQSFEYPLNSGQLSKAVQSFTLGILIKRAASVSEQILSDQSQGNQIFSQVMQQEHSSQTDFAEFQKIFVQRIAEIQDYHARHQISQVNRVPLEEGLLKDIYLPRKKRKLQNVLADGYDLYSLLHSELIKIQNGSLFSTEEVFGKYLDLHSVYDAFLHVGFSFGSNSSGATETKSKENEGQKLHYSHHINQVDFIILLQNGLHKMAPEASKLTRRKKYIRFLQELHDYIVSFLNRTVPLLDVENEVLKVANDLFDREWGRDGGITGWECKAVERVLVSTDVSDTASTANSNDDEISMHIDLGKFDTLEELIKEYPADVLKVELARLGMKCGGTSFDLAKRLWSTKNVKWEDLPSKLFVKGAKPVMKTGTNKISPNSSKFITQERRIDIARFEFVVNALLDQVRPALDSTARRAERRLTQTSTEKQLEIEEEISGIYQDRLYDIKDNNDTNESDDDEDAPVYNPKGVPLGWDGKPIPYWLFKLHGLGHFFSCEICGNETYRGRHNFEKHFAEAKHTYGMKCLGIPNTKHFHGVTKIEDAQHLWTNLQHNIDKDVFDASKEEEYEDSHGNVLSRATYEDLARQGLL